MGCGSLCVSIPTLGGPPCIDDDIDGDDIDGVELDMMLALQNQLYPGISFGMACVDEEDM